MSFFKTLPIVLPSSLAVGIALYFPSYGVYKSTSKIDELIEMARGQYAAEPQVYATEFSAPQVLTPKSKPQSLSRSQLKNLIARTENKYGIPEKLMLAISTVESTLRPWAVYARPGGKPTSKFFKTKEQAVQYIKELKQEGRININIGSMQINLQSHGERFQSIEHALDPKINIDYAGYMLKSLYKRLGSWEMAVRHYHTSKDEYNLPYKDVVWQTWEVLKQKS